MNYILWMRKAFEEVGKELSEVLELLVILRAVNTFTHLRLIHALIDGFIDSLIRIFSG